MKYRVPSPFCSCPCYCLLENMTFFVVLTILVMATWTESGAPEPSQNKSSGPWPILLPSLVFSSTLIRVNEAGPPGPLNPEEIGRLDPFAQTRVADDMQRFTTDSNELNFLNDHNYAGFDQAYLGNYVNFSAFNGLSDHDDTEDRNFNAGFHHPYQGNHINFSSTNGLSDHDDEEDRDYDENKRSFIEAAKRRGGIEDRREGKKQSFLSGVFSKRIHGQPKLHDFLGEDKSRTQRTEFILENGTDTVFSVATATAGKVEIFLKSHDPSLAVSVTCKFQRVSVHFYFQGDLTANLSRDAEFSDEPVEYRVSSHYSPAAALLFDVRQTGGDITCSAHEIIPGSCACGKFLFDPSATRSPPGRIVNGRPASYVKYPWMVSIMFRGLYSNTYFCGGSVIGRRWVLTAAHCMEAIPETKRSHMAVVVGTSDLKNPKSSRTLSISKYILHPKYDTNTMENDVALIQTDGNLFDVVNLFDVRPLCLPKTDANLTGTAATVAGWGLINEDGNSSTKLLSTTVHILSRERCAELYNDDDDTDASNTDDDDDDDDDDDEEDNNDEDDEEDNNDEDDEEDNNDEDDEEDNNDEDEDESDDVEYNDEYTEYVEYVDDEDNDPEPSPQSAERTRGRNSARWTQKKFMEELDTHASQQRRKYAVNQLGKLRNLSAWKKILQNPDDGLSDEIICASNFHEQSDACQGDSGGPLFQEDPEGHVVQVGIVSWGRGCGNPYHPGVYSKVSKYEKWIRSYALDAPNCS